MLTVITHSFPTRRPSDLDELKGAGAAPGVRPAQRRADPRRLRSRHAPERERALGRQQVAVRPAALQPNPLAGAIARAGGERARRAGLLGNEHGHIFGIVTRTFAGRLRFGGDGREQAGRNERLPEIVDHPAVVKVAALETREHLDMLRSEEHTSELQSLMRISYAVFCLKKNKKKKH